MLLAAGRRELADDRAVLHLTADEEERRRQVDDDPVDLAAVQRRDDVVRRVVDARLRRWLDRVLDVGELVVPTWAPSLYFFEVGERRTFVIGFPVSPTSAWLTL